MKHVKQILVATDCSKVSDNAIKRAIKIAKIHKAKITLLFVAREGHLETLISKVVPKADRVMYTPKQYGNRLIKKKLAEFEKADVNIKGVALVGHPATKILQYAKEKKMDLIVVGVRGHYTINDWFVGTTTEMIAKQTKIPVLIVRNSARKAYKKLLIPIDFSISSKSALEFGITGFSNIKQTKIEVLHVGEHDYDDFIGDDKYIKFKSNAVRKGFVSIIKNKIEPFIKKSGGSPDKIQYQIKTGYPSVEIIKETNENDFDLVILGSSGHSERYYLMLGRVATRVLYEVNADVFLIP